MLNRIYNVMVVISVIVMFWLLLSWFDVIIHNTPSGGYEYSSWNVFEIMLNCTK